MRVLLPGQISEVNIGYQLHKKEMPVILARRRILIIFSGYSTNHHENIVLC
jgi:hypothetical protein